MSRAVVQYAGALAVNKVERVTAAQIEAVDANMGVLAVSPDETTFALDLSSKLWKDVLHTGEYIGDDKVGFVDQDELLRRYLEQVPAAKSFWNWFSSASEVTPETLDELAVKHWQAEDRGIFDRLHFRAVEGVSTVQLADRNYEVATQTGNDTHVDLYIGNDDNNTIFGTIGNDLVFGGSNSDKLYTRGGRDVLIVHGEEVEVIDYLPNSQSNNPSLIDDIIFGAVGNDGEGKPLSLQKQFELFLKESGSGKQVSYTAKDPDGEGEQHPDKGVEITNLVLGDSSGAEAVEITVLNLNNGHAETDALAGINVVNLSEQRDVFNLSANSLKAPILINMGGFSDGYTEIDEEGDSQTHESIITKADYDVLSFEGVSGPVVALNGVVTATVRHQIKWDK